MRKLNFYFFLVVISSCSHPHVNMGKLPNETHCIAVLPFEVRFDATITNEVLSEFLSIELIDQGAGGVLGPVEATQLFKQAHDPLPPAIDPYWAKKIGNRLGVDGVIFGSMTQIPIVRSNKAAKANPDWRDSVLLSVDAYFINPKSNEMSWAYGVKEEVNIDDLTKSLNQHAYYMALSLMQDHPDNMLFSHKGCWTNPIATKEEGLKKELSHPQKMVQIPTPEPTTTPAPAALLSKSQERLLNNLKRNQMIEFSDTIFKGRSSQISKTGVVKMRDLAVALLDPVAPPSIQISGHVDATENEGSDLQLSKARAQEIKKYLESIGVEGDRIKAVGFGGTKPLLPNINSKSRAMNLRTEVLGLSGKQKKK